MPIEENKDQIEEETKENMTDNVHSAVRRFRTEPPRHRQGGLFLEERCDPDTLQFLKINCKLSAL